jgi:predicted RNase H-like HicB family nuclease
MKFNLICEIDEDGRYVVECPDLPGCISEGDTLEEALDNINEAITGCLKSRLIIAKEHYLKKIMNVQNKFRISLDTKMAAEYA